MVIIVMICDLFVTVPMYPPPRPKPRTETPVCRYYPRCTNLNCTFAHPKVRHGDVMAHGRGRYGSLVVGGDVMAH